LERKRTDRRVLLIVDEAQNLQKSTLEEIRLLSNLETSTSKLIQILLFGQPELDEMLDSRELRQLRQRISVRWALEPLTPDEVSEYVRHRMRIAAGGECDIFSPRALRELCRRAGGIPRLVNLLADRALLAGYAAGKRTIAPRLVNDAAREILRAPRRRGARRRLIRNAVAVLAVVGVVAAGTLAWREIGLDSVFTGRGTAPAPAAKAPSAAGRAVSEGPRGADRTDAGESG
jgi:general secretion pathway protein A